MTKEVLDQTTLPEQTDGSPDAAGLRQVDNDLVDEQ